MQQTLRNFETASLMELALEFKAIEAELASINARVYALNREVNNRRNDLAKPFNNLVHPEKGVARYCEFMESQTSELINCARGAASTLSHVDKLLDAQHPEVLVHTNAERESNRAVDYTIPFRHAM